MRSNKGRRCQKVHERRRHGRTERDDATEMEKAQARAQTHGEAERGNEETHGQPSVGERISLSLVSPLLLPPPPSSLLYTR